MVRRTFLKKAALAAVGAAVTSPLSALAKQPKGSARKKVLLINGSPRPDGNTFCALQEIATQLEKHGIEAEIFQIGNKPVRMCISCGGCRRGGATASLQTLNMMFEMMNMPVVTSQYWNIAYGAAKGEAKRDAEGMQTMRTLADNMAWLLDKIHAEGGKPAPDRDEPHTFTNFIR